MHKNFEINRTKIKGGCQSGRKVVTHNSKSDLPLTIIMRKYADLPENHMSSSHAIRAHAQEV